MTTTHLLTLTPEAASWLVHAIRDKENVYRRNGMRVPDGVPQVREQVALSATAGHPGPRMASPEPAVDVQPVAQRLLTYGETARVLGCSLRTVKRRVRDGVLPTVGVGEGSLRRIHVDDVDAYIARRKSCTAGTNQGELG